MNSLVWHSPPISSCVYVPVCSYALPLDFVFLSSQIPDYFPPSSFIPSLLVFFFFFLLKMSLLGMNTDWFVLKLINCWRKTCGWPMRQPQRGPRKALASEGAPPHRWEGKGPSLPPCTSAGMLASCSGATPGLRDLWQRPKHTAHSCGMTLLLVLAGARG